MSNHDTKHDAGERDYQDRDIRIKPIIYFGIATTLFTVVTAYAIQYYYGVLAEKEAHKNQPAVIMERELPKDLTLQVREFADLAAFQEKERNITHTYGWVNRDAGVVRLPIEKAMELVIERGLPIRAPQPTP